MTQKNYSNVIATFSFPNGLNGSVKCRVDYGISAESLNSSLEIDSDQENVTIVLPIPAQLMSTVTS